METVYGQGFDQPSKNTVKEGGSAMTRKATPEEMAKRTVLMRARSEGNILRAYFLNEVIPALEKEFDKRLAEGQNLMLEMPDVDEFARAYVNKILKTNKQIT